MIEKFKRALVNLNKKVLTALRSDEADAVVDMPIQQGGFERLSSHDHCLVVSYKRDGNPVAQPVWPGYEGDKVFIWTEVEAYKAKRIRRNPETLIAPCNFRGKPLGNPIAARGRILETEAERQHAEQTIKSQWGWKRKAFAASASPLTDVHYIELVPATSAG
jgi:PPOX class probable F420-dependent enzyme